MLGYSALEFGVGFVVTPVAAAVGMIVAQAAILKVGFRPVAATGMALLGAGSLLLTQASMGGSYFGDIFFGLLVFGLGIGPAFVTASIAALEGVAERESGLASGLSNTAFQLGGALGVAIVSTVAVSRSENFLAANEGANPLVVLTEGFQSAFVACVVLAGIGVALALLLLGRPRRPRSKSSRPLPRRPPTKRPQGGTGGRGKRCQRTMTRTTRCRADATTPPPRCRRWSTGPLGRRNGMR